MDEGESEPGRTGAEEAGEEAAGEIDGAAGGGRGAPAGLETGVERPMLDALPGLVRRARRRLGMSQRALARALGVSQSRVARWETGRTVPSAADLEEVLALAGVRLVTVDEAGKQVQPMSPLAARDRANRYYPAHCDPRGEGWWAPPGSSTTVEGVNAWRRSRQLGVPRITYDRGVWRAMMRLAYGTPLDHPTPAQVVDQLRASGAEWRRAS